MKETEFDKFAQEYREIHKKVLGPSGEDTDFFTEYKVKDCVNQILSLSFPADLKILDFGSGIGQSVPYFLNQLPDAKITCLDVSRNSLEIGQENHNGKADFLHFDGSAIPKEDNTFHVVFSACVFHHIPAENHQSLFNEIRRILKPGGILIVFEHNPLNFLTVKAVNSCPLDENAKLIYGRKLLKLIRDNGYLMVNLRYRIFFPRFLKLLRPLEKFLTWLPLGAQYYILAQKNK